MTDDDLERLAVRCLHAVKDAELHAFDEMPMYDVEVLDTARLAALREVLREALDACSGCEEALETRSPCPKHPYEW